MDRVSENPYRSPKVTECDVPQERQKAANGSEIRRLAFALSFIGTIATVVATLSWLESVRMAANDSIGTGIYFAGVAIAVWLTFARSRSIGIAGSWGLFVTIPLINYLFLIAWLALPEGYAIHKRIDRGGYLMVIFGLLAIPVGIAFAIFA